MVSKWHVGVGLGALMAIALSTGARADETYIPLISKGFQHQFWQAVKLGAEQSAKENNVKITFEGPETEAMVDKQIDMLSAALAKHPQAIGFAALDSQAAIPLLKKAQAGKIPVIAFNSGVDSDIPLTTCTTNNVAAAAACRRQDGRSDRRRGRSRRHRPRSDQPHRHRPARRLPRPHEGEISEHQDRQRPIWRRRSFEVGRNRQGR